MRSNDETTPHDSVGPDDISGLDALALVVSVYGPERLMGPGASRISDRALRDAVRRLVAESRARGMVGAERLVIELRRAWSRMPAVRVLSPDRPRQELWDRIVTLCCEEFYTASRVDISPAPLRHAR